MGQQICVIRLKDALVIDLVLFIPIHFDLIPLVSVLFPFMSVLFPFKLHLFPFKCCLFPLTLFFPFSTHKGSSEKSPNIVSGET